MRKTIWGLALLVVVAFLASCSEKSEYTHAIPKDAAMVTSLDFMSMAQKSGIDGKEGEKAVAKLADALKSGLEGNAYKTAEKILNNPAESGLSLTDKVYLFMTPYAETFGILAKVSDEDKVNDLLNALKEQQVCSDLKSEKGCTWTQMNEALCAFDNGTFLLLSSTKGDASALKGTMFSLMGQDKENSFAQTIDFAKLNEAKGDIAMVMNMSITPSDLSMQMRMGMPAEMKLEDMKYLMTVNFEKGKIAMQCQSLIENKELIAMYDKQTAASELIKGTYLSHFPASTLLWMGGNIKGEQIFDLLCENPTIKQSIENPMLPVDIKSIFSSIHGDVAIGYNSLAENGILIYADVTNSQFLQSFEDLRPLLAMTGGQMELNLVGKEQYEFRMQQQSIWFGVKDGMLYISNNKVLASEAGRQYNPSLKNVAWQNEVSKNRFFMAFNAEQLAREFSTNPNLAAMLGSDASIFSAVLTPCEYMDIMAPDWKSATINIVMKDKETNVLRLIVGGLESL